jgi:hypothetical protein
VCNFWKPIDPGESGRGLDVQGTRCLAGGHAWQQYRAVGAAAATKSSAPRFERASSPAIAPMEPGVSGMTSRRKASHAAAGDWLLGGGSAGRHAGSHDIATETASGYLFVACWAKSWSDALRSSAERAAKPARIAPNSATTFTAIELAATSPFATVRPAGQVETRPRAASPRRTSYTGVTCI